ncbi:prepilin-type N-terminal cleavage/methylation domain-containing protein [Clostridium sp. ZS2-4]|uniref:prepilin-type N-terminal cleavage/methylation domain-containing protein n=1 Tax=Clostridium sp. ZS2-4 TaxID=2987703 RepID=UPI00227C44D2|nr:prepilin-type N-terminal cleavage/methylation domain-containing protein [Clostridium sp. ZS2-4]MCY6355048.1 prepilin-type N-terminal cleavage/methylation domain-containing protein [Clostridium sp. ZS2-4]
MRKSKGFTLLELIISIAILGIILIPLSDMVLTSVRFAKASHDKQVATNLVQQDMEKIKSGEISSCGSHDEGNLHVQYSIQPVTGYKFGNNSVSGEKGSDSITCDYKIVFPKGSGVVKFYNGSETVPIIQQDIIKPHIIIKVTDSKIEFTLKDKEIVIGDKEIDRICEVKNGKVKIRFDIFRDLGQELLVDADNETSEILELYFVKVDTLNSQPEINLIKHSGIIRQYNDILKIEDDSSVSNEPNRLYKVTVKVTDKKTGEILIEDKGYKTFLK